MIEIGNRDQEHRRFRARLIVTTLLVLLAFGILLARLVWLQVIRHDVFSTRAEDNRIAIVAEAPHRGLILDRNGEVLARNVAAYTLEISPGRVGDIDKTIEALAGIIDISLRERRRFLRLREENRSTDSLPLKTRLSDEEVARFAAARYRFPGVEIKARLFRQYPYGTTASHVIGYIGRINDRDREKLEERGQWPRYRGSEHIGKFGIELSYEDVLHGHPGYREMEVDAAGHPVRVLSQHEPVPGQTVRLTLDIKLQQLAESLFEGRRGALVATDPATGEVLAFVSQPGYDPNLFVDGIDTESWNALNNSPDKPLLNRALRGIYPPGSTFKMFMALAGLETGKRTPQWSMADPGYYEFGGHRFRDDKPGGHGRVDLYKSIVESCDTYYYLLATELGIEIIDRFMAQFGFGSRTGIDLQAEAEGVLPSPGWKRSRYRHPSQQRWYAGDTVSIGIGQGYNAYTPLQLVQAVSAIANGGRIERPHLMQQIEQTDGTLLRRYDTTPVRVLKLKPRHLKVVHDAMVGVTLEGTGRIAFANTPYRSAGKTGTAQVFNLKGEKYEEKNVRERLRDHGWYVGYAPAEAPRIAVVALVENGGFGSQSAAPIVRRMFDRFLLGETPAVTPQPPVVLDAAPHAPH